MKDLKRISPMPAITKDCFPSDSTYCFLSYSYSHFDPQVFSCHTCVSCVNHSPLFVVFHIYTHHSTYQHLNLVLIWPLKWRLSFLLIILLLLISPFWFHRTSTYFSEAGRRASFSGLNLVLNSQLLLGSSLWDEGIWILLSPMYNIIILLESQLFMK